MTTEANDIERWLDCYDPEHRVFPDLSSSQNRKLSKREILLILKWKLGRIKEINAETVSKKSLAKINDAIKTAADDKCAAVKTLKGVRGIGLATATAILTVCYPDDFTIIDQRVLEVLQLVPSRLKDKSVRGYSTDDWSAEEYIKEYLTEIMKRKNEWGLTLRDTDRALWGKSVSHRIDNHCEK